MGTWWPQDLRVGEESLSAKGHSQIEKSEKEQLSLGHSSSRALKDKVTRPPALSRPKKGNEARQLPSNPAPLLIWGLG